ncbi:hypothetical protein B0J15DRAFT_106284 [Fusarium solani]|uniref:Uncharacterized protein n=1 Tax=Fusarium solani TaxID=169388 RepID=A0A9P9L3T5_FUSSL|nr:uncharacterized protein B0J15DRAFT_106284 [Fusarium solani]KAH7273631.1 hypothetical protein B0J15DRAFT_106284 [Fusarium solani]
MAWQCRVTYIERLSSLALVLAGDRFCQARRKDIDYHLNGPRLWSCQTWIVIGIGLGRAGMFIKNFLGGSPEGSLICTRLFWGFGDDVVDVKVVVYESLCWRWSFWCSGIHSGQMSARHERWMWIAS